MPTRVHIHIKAAELEASREFYRQFLGVEPVKDIPDHIKFLLPFAPLSLVISPARTPSAANRRAAVNHLGLELPSTIAIQEHLARVKLHGLSVREQLNVNCCYANQSKFWVIDPDGIEWEVYHVNYDLVERHGGGVEEPNCDPPANDALIANSPSSGVVRHPSVTWCRRNNTCWRNTSGC